MVESAAKAEVEEAKVEKEGKKVGTLKVTIYEDKPAKVEIVERLPGFGFKHIKLAKVGMQRCFRAMRKVESAKTTPTEEKQKKNAQVQTELDEKAEAEMKRIKESKEPNRRDIKNALMHIAAQREQQVPSTVKE